LPTIFGRIMVATKGAGYHAAVVHIGDKLKEARIRELLTQQELAEKSGVGVNTIIRIERNQVEPHFRTIRKLAEALGIDPKALL
jgi:transcriptional regulator with XRE-family HTH domain